MKFYVYISDSKIDMLLPQVPHEVKKKVATEFGIDLKVLTAKRTAEAEPEDNRIKRLETVVRFIRQHENVGTVDESDDYIDDVLSMRWGPYGWDASGSVSGPVYFGGETEKTVFGLGGSSKHLVGDAGLTGNVDHPHVHSHSLTPYLLAFLEKEQLASGGMDRQTYARDGQSTRDSLGYQQGLHAVFLATTQMSGPKQRLEFLAKRLLCGRKPLGIPPQSVTHVLLGSPLYVAMAE
jgi:hypothetical protein